MSWMLDYTVHWLACGALMFLAAGSFIEHALTRWARRKRSTRAARAAVEPILRKLWGNPALITKRQMQSTAVLVASVAATIEDPSYPIEKVSTMEPEQWQVLP